MWDVMTNDYINKYYKKKISKYEIVYFLYFTKQKVYKEIIII